LQKYRFFSRSDKPILCVTQNERVSAMTTFWKNLHRMTQDQMFTHGYLAPRIATEIAAKRQAQDARDCNEKRRASRPWPRLAAFR
jgi:hypothetical protein